MRYRTGQAALIVTLVVIVALTVAVGVASRSVTTVSVSTQEQERARAFSAAEAGVEDALRQNLSTLVGAGNINVPLGESSANYQVSRLTSASANINPGEVVTVDWTSGTETSVNVSWSGCSQMENTSIAANGNVNRTVTSGTSATVTKGVYQLARLRLINCSPAPVPVTVTGNTAGATLSFYKVDSLGTSVSGEASSRVQAVRSESAAPGVMDYAIFSGGGIQ